MRPVKLLKILPGLVVVVAFLSMQQQNGIPKVSLQFKPATNTFGSSSLNYSISIEDKEDGSTRYNEIAANEVFLKIKFLPDSSDLPEFLVEQSRADPVVRKMKKEICFSCHSLKQKLIGPSFESIAKKYAGEANRHNILADRIIKGSSGIWSDGQIMPAHPELTRDDARAMAEWLVRYGADKNFEYVPGLEGKIITSNFANLSPASILVLIPGYLDHGANGQPAMEGSQLVKLRYHQ